MASRKRNVDAESAFGSASLSDYPGVGSRPSKTNCTSGVSGSETPELDFGKTKFQELDEADLTPDDWWRWKNVIVDSFLQDRPQRAARPISVRGGTKIRDEAAAEKYTEGEDEKRFRSKSWSSVLNEFLRWYNDYRGAKIVFGSPEGEEVRGPMENSHMPQYGDRFYARLKGLERQVPREFDDPHSVMLTLSGSSRNANGGWRCPADHLRDVVSSWRPTRGRGVYHTLRDVLKGRRWVYAVIIEKHQSGYGHVHCAVFVDGEVEDGDFHRVIDAHLRQCEIAGREAHDYHSPDPENRPISVMKIDPGNAEDDSIGNLGSYVGEYIGAYGEELFARGLDELIFRSAAWATGTQIVRFSKGANELIDRDRGYCRTNKSDTVVRPNPDFDPEYHGNGISDVFPFEIENPGWALIGIARGPGDDEPIFEIQRSEVVWREIDDASRMDPPKQVPADRPRLRSRSSDLSSY